MCVCVIVFLLMFLHSFVDAHNKKRIFFYFSFNSFLNLTLVYLIWSLLRLNWRYKSVGYRISMIREERRKKREGERKRERARDRITMKLHGEAKNWVKKKARTTTTNMDEYKWDFCCFIHRFIYRRCTVPISNTLFIVIVVVGCHGFLLLCSLSLFSSSYFITALALTVATYSASCFNTMSTTQCCKNIDTFTNMASICVVVCFFFFYRTLQME